MISYEICAVLIFVGVFLGFGAGIYVSLPKKKKKDKPPTTVRYPDYNQFC